MSSYRSYTRAKTEELSPGILQSKIIFGGGAARKLLRPKIKDNLNASTVLL